jgi:hypothetical protein
MMTTTTNATARTPLPRTRTRTRTRTRRWHCADVAYRSIDNNHYLHQRRKGPRVPRAPAIGSDLNIFRIPPAQPPHRATAAWDANTPGSKARDRCSRAPHASMRRKHAHVGVMNLTNGVWGTRPYLTHDPANTSNDPGRRGARNGVLTESFARRTHKLSRTGRAGVAAVAARRDRYLAGIVMTATHTATRTRRIALPHQRRTPIRTRRWHCADLLDRAFDVCHRRRHRGGKDPCRARAASALRGRAWPDDPAYASRIRRRNRIARPGRRRTRRPSHAC